MVHFFSGFANALRATLMSIFNGLKWIAHRNSMLLAVARAMRKLFEPKPPKLLAGFEPLHLEEKKLAEFADISPALRDEVLAEFAEIARIFAGKPTGLTAGYQWWAQHPLDDLMASAANLNIVYTPGKVGSSSVLATLTQHPSFKDSVRFVHFLSSMGLAFIERQLVERWTGRPAASAIWRDSLFLGHWMRALIAVNRALRAKNGLSGTAVRKPHVIVGVREPVGLHLSACFQFCWMYGDSPLHLTADFVHARLADDAWHRHCNNWFTNDLAMMFGIDVYARPFPAERGWDIYENDAARVLLIRQESLSGIPEALGALYGFDPKSFNVATTNTAEGKDYAARYEVVKKTLRLSQQELEEIYSLPYVRHFYTPKEIAAFKSRWQAAASRLPLAA